MGKKDVDTPTKTQKSSPTQEQPPATHVAYPDWASFQAYYYSVGTAPDTSPGYFHYSMASNPQTQPYMWAPQIIPPYGTSPTPYVAVYHPMGFFPHPSNPMTAITNHMEMDGRTVENKEKSSIKRSKESIGNLNTHMGRGDAKDKGSGTSANGALSQSGESGSEISSEGSDANSENDLQRKQQSSGEDRAQNDKTAESTSSEGKHAQNMQTVNYIMPLTTIPPSGVDGPRTTRKPGMTYWGDPASSSSVQCTETTAPSGLARSRNSDAVDPSILDERELRRQKRKQANRESARRSRLRKLAEAEELGQRVLRLTEENDSLRKQLARLKEDCEKLASETAVLDKLLGGKSGAADIPKTEADDVSEQ